MESKNMPHDHTLHKHAPKQDVKHGEMDQLAAAANTRSYADALENGTAYLYPPAEPIDVGPGDKIPGTRKKVKTFVIEE